MTAHADQPAGEPAARKIALTVASDTVREII
jgi:hypothetical protein